jgi:peptidoglycan/LPS O-acetylase OafA/YrhL
MGLLGIVVENTSFGDKRFINEATGKKDKTMWANTFLSFNPIRNFQKVFHVEANGPHQDLQVLNGIRVLSMCWVIMGHGYLFPLFVGVTNAEAFLRIEKEFWFTLIPGGYYAVDTFYILSGFLVVYLMLGKLYPAKGRTNYPLLYFHRFYRLVPAILFLTGFVIYIFPLLGTGPMFYTTALGQKKNCESYWWANVLFINNMIPWSLSDECTGQVWYLANDM